MKRSLFLQLPLVASALLANAKNPPKDRGKKGFKVEAGKDHFQEELLIMGGSFDCKVSGKDTDGDLCIYDTVRQEKGDSAFAPRKVPHAFAKTGEGEGQMLILFQPAGSMEDYFKQVRKLGGSIKDQAQRSKDLMKSLDMEVVGPPLKI